jgi:hypothetical protein
LTEDRAHAVDQVSGAPPIAYERLDTIEIEWSAKDFELRLVEVPGAIHEISSAAAFEQGLAADECPASEDES